MFLWQRMEGVNGLEKVSQGQRPAAAPLPIKILSLLPTSRPFASVNSLRSRQFHSDLPPFIFLQCYLFATFMSLKTTSFRFLLLFVWAEDGKRVSLQHSQLPSSLAPERRPRPQPIPPNSIPSPLGRSPPSPPLTPSSMPPPLFPCQFFLSIFLLFAGPNLPLGHPSPFQSIWQCQPPLPMPPPPSSASGPIPQGASTRAAARDSQSPLIKKMAVSECRNSSGKYTHKTKMWGMAGGKRGLFGRTKAKTFPKQRRPRKFGGHPQSAPTDPTLKTTRGFLAHICCHPSDTFPFGYPVRRLSQTPFQIANCVTCIFLHSLHQFDRDGMKNPIFFSHLFSL